MHLHNHDHSHGPGDGDQDFSSEPLDTSSQSLADALQVSFRILKFVLAIVVVLYFCSGVRRLEQNERALVFRLGELQPEERGPGLVWALPRPIDQLVIVPVMEKRTTTIVTQDLHLKPDQERSSVRRTGGLDPKLDGSIMTGDRGLVHAQWIVTYEIGDLWKFVNNVYDADSGGEEDLIKHAVENAAIHVIGQMEAVDVVRHKIGEIQGRVRSRAQQILMALDTGIEIANIDAKPAWPVQIKGAFEKVTKKSNEKSKMIDQANKRSVEILNKTAGASHVLLGEQFDEYFVIKSSGDRTAAEAKMAEIEETILSQASGEASEIIQDARSFKKKALEDIEGDAMEFRSYLASYKRNPRMLFSRLWYDAQEEIMSNPGVTKRHLPQMQKEIRIVIGPDPVEKKAREEERLKKKDRVKGDFSDVARRRSGHGGSAARMIR